VIAYQFDGTWDGNATPSSSTAISDGLRTKTSTAAVEQRAEIGPPTVGHGLLGVVLHARKPSATPCGTRSSTARRSFASLRMTECFAQDDRVLRSG
jgi:hypothetical protein